MNNFFEIKGVMPLKSDFDFSNKLFIAVLKPQTIPPHLILIHNNLYYDLRVHKSKIAVDLKKIKTTIVVGKIPTLFFEVAINKKLISKDLLVKCFDNLTFNTENKTTCLTPIKQAVSETLEITCSSASTIFELLEQLKRNNSIKNTFHLSCEEIISNGNLKWKKYSTEQLFEGFEDLKTIVNA